jgi:hypothetical protein
VSSFEYVEADQPHDPVIESLFVPGTVVKVTSDGCIQLETPDFVLKRRLVSVPREKTRIPAIGLYAAAAALALAASAVLNLLRQ